MTALKVLAGVLVLAAACNASYYGSDNWGPWSKWCACTKKCGGGQQWRVRKCLSGPYEPPCTGKAKEIKSCNSKACARDGGWSSWRPAGQCSVTCGNGQQLYERKCNNPTPLNGGKPCPGDSKQHRPCSTGKQCPINGGWSSWRPSGSCSVTCGSGRQPYTRQCNNPRPQHGGADCSGARNQHRPCSTGRQCPINGGWSSWRPSGSCSVTCGNGRQPYTRQCNNPRPQHGGADCSGARNQHRPCNTGTPCPIHGGWGPWRPSGQCSVTCGNGQQPYTRQCNNPRPQHEGNRCSGLNRQSRACNTGTPCPIHGGWASWGPYGSCSASCGGGRQSRSRTCTNPRPMFGGRTCSGSGQSSQACNQQPCPVVIRISLPSYRVVERNGPVQVRVTRTGDLSRPITARLSTTPGSARPGQDFTSFQNRPVQFNPGQSSVNIPISITDDNRVEPQESFTITLSSGNTPSVTVSRSRATVTIIDDDVEIRLSPRSYRVVESNGPAQVTVTRTGDLSRPVTARLTTTRGSARPGPDFTALRNTPVQFRPGQQSARVPIPITKDNTVESQEAFTVTLSSDNSQYVTVTSPKATVTIVDDDAVLTFVKRSYIVPETVRKFTVVVKRTGATNFQHTGSVKTRYVQSAKPSADYVKIHPKTLTFASGQTEKTVEVTIIDDKIDEKTEKFHLVLTTNDPNASVGQETTIVYIKDNDVDGQWGNWGPWRGVCNVPCGGGTKSRKRFCNRPSPRGGGRRCSGQDHQTKQCPKRPSVNGFWSSWSQWSSCSAPCSTPYNMKYAFIKRHRKCIGPYCGGKSCYGQKYQGKKCYSKPCPYLGQSQGQGGTNPYQPKPPTKPVTPYRRRKRSLGKRSSSSSGGRRHGGIGRGWWHGKYNYGNLGYRYGGYNRYGRYGRRRRGGRRGGGSSKRSVAKRGADDGKRAATKRSDSSKRAVAKRSSSSSGRGRHGGIGHGWWYGRHYYGGYGRYGRRRRGGGGSSKRSVAKRGKSSKKYKYKGKSGSRKKSKKYKYKGKSGSRKGSKGRRHSHGHHGRGSYGHGHHGNHGHHGGHGGHGGYSRYGGNHGNGYGGRFGWWRYGGFGGKGK